jgi:hypothetical protein
MRARERRDPAARKTPRHSRFLAPAGLTAHPPRARTLPQAFRDVSDGGPSAPTAELPVEDPHIEMLIESDLSVPEESANGVWCWRL